MDVEVRNVLFFFVGLIIGLVFMLFTFTLGNEPIRTDALDEVCVKLYGNNTHWVEGRVGSEANIVCADIPTIKEELHTKELIYKI